MGKPITIRDYIRVCDERDALEDQCGELVGALFNEYLDHLEEIGADVFPRVEKLRLEVASACRVLVVAGLIEDDGEHYRLTEQGRAMVGGGDDG